MKKRWITPAIVLAILILAGVLRWDFIDDKTTEHGITQWYYDRWTGETWARYYSTNYSESPITHYGSPEPRQIKEYTTIAWKAAIGISSLWLVLSFRPKSEPRIE